MQAIAKDASTMQANMSAPKPGPQFRKPYQSLDSGHTPMPFNRFNTDYYPLSFYYPAISDQGSNDF